LKVIYSLGKIFLISQKRMSLKGKTIFITGASRGIGLAIALRAAQDGANIVIAAKTADPNPKLPGTIYSAAAEIEKAGGKCLPCAVDIRYEDQVQAAVDKAVATFGGIDILINNASAISLTGTLDTPAKKFDLMMGINTRGTYVTSRACLPHLLKSKNPHILNISPPLSMEKKWFKNHVAYTMAKYGMSMCVLGMSEEFRDDGVAVNALWPRTAIWTAAMRMLGGDPVAKGCRTSDIMADSAYWILTQPSKATTGQFFVDEDVLRATGVSNFDKYACVPGNPLVIDFFLEGANTDFQAKL
jgi:citronellol/citronellal dehydrogenase